MSLSDRLLAQSNTGLPNNVSTAVHYLHGVVRTLPRATKNHAYIQRLWLGLAATWTVSIGNDPIAHKISQIFALFAHPPVSPFKQMSQSLEV